jgi:hypothetical protein
MAQIAFIASLGFAGVQDPGLQHGRRRFSSDWLRPFFEFGLAAGCEIARSTGHVAVRMIFDAAHVQSMDGDLLGHMERNWDLIKVV